MILPRTSIVAMMLPASAGAGSPSRAAAATHTAVAEDLAAAHCASLPTEMASRWPDPSTSIVSASWVPAGPQALSVQPGSRSIDVPAHCELIGVLRNRVGADGQHYAIRFHLRLPHGWSGRFFFQGGGGSNGVLGDALGVYSSLVPPALAQRYAVVSQDSGHDNQLNSDPARGGVLAFGFDAIARADYGHASLPLVAQAARAAIRAYYGSAPKRSYFVGCSKGGEEGLALAERYGREFDGIAAGAPGMSLPRAAVTEAWDTQAFAAAVKTSGEGPVSLADLPRALSDADLTLVRSAVLAACDADDGLADGIIGDFRHCTNSRVLPELEKHRCAAGQQAEGCLRPAQIDGLLRVMAGPHDGAGHALYSDWPWDTGIASPGWRLWKLGGAQGVPPSLNVVLGGASLAMVFSTPPVALPANPQQLLEFQLQFNFDRDAAKIYARDAQFPRSAWEDISARSANLSEFQAHRGKLLLTHGVSDPVFSINDTIAWLQEVRAANGRHAADFVQLFAVPGMTHCGGGDATDQFDVLAPLVQWVEHGKSPAKLIAKADPHSPWPQRTRPLCPYPRVARYMGTGDPDRAENFECRL